MTLPPKLHFTVGIPTDSGFLGRECNAPECRRYFKVHLDSIQPQMYCPYCGVRFGNDSLWTPEQLEYAKQKVAQEVMPLLAQEVRDTFRRAFHGRKGFTFKPGPPIQPGPEPPLPEEKSVDSERQCPECSTRFQVDGIFDYCPGCREENLKLYDANLAIIRHEVRKASNPSRALRHAYNDLVSTFETFARREADRHGIAQGRFQNPDHTRRTFRSILGVDIFADLDDAEIRTLKRVFEKRHVHDHAGGVATERYVREIPEDAHLLGQHLPLSLDELETAAVLLRRALEHLIAAR